MFAKLALPLITVSALATSVFASPLSIQANTVSRRNHGHVSFNNYNGFQDMANFDSFYGVDDFNGHNRHQTIDSSQNVVCHSQSVEIVQQRLAVLQEMAKQIVTELSCEVESQVVVFEQYYQSLGHFHDDLRRHSGYQVGYDQGICSHFSNIYNGDGSLCFDDWNFSGSDIGSQTIVVQDSNWNEATSHQSVDGAYYASKNSYFVSQYSH